MWKSPIEIIKTDIQTRYEEKVMEAVLSCGINVNKEELIKALQYDRQQYRKGYEDAKVEQQWIPYSERLPEEEVDVLICNKDGNIEISSGSYSTEAKDCWIWYTSGWRFGKVVAWMPLPEPYQSNRKGADNEQT